MKNLWDDDDVLSERELVEEIDQSEELAREYDAKPFIAEPTIEQVEQIQQESAFNLDDDEIDIVYNARLRLEQAKLYEMLINHDLFENVDADANAIENVQTELKQYIVERLEVLLGIRQEKKKVIKPQDVEINLPFNDIEIDFLKQLSYKGTKGASIGTPIKTPKNNDLKPLSNSSSFNKLKPMGSPVKKAQPVSNKKVVTPTPRASTKPNNTPQKKIRSNSIKPRNLTQQEIEALAKQDINEMSSRKPWAKMNNKEKAKEIARVNTRHARTKVESAIPMPTPEQLEMKYSTEQSMIASTNKLASLHNIIAGKIINGQYTKIKQEE